MPHIHTQPGQHDLTVTAVIVRQYEDGDRKTLLHMHKKHHKLLQVGGHVELNETPWQAIAHEIIEEAGYDLEQLKVLQPRLRLQSMSGAVSHPLPLVVNTHNITEGHFHTDLLYGFTTITPPLKPVGEDESTDIRWYSAGEIDNIDPSLIYENTRQTVRFIIQNLDVWDQVATGVYEK